MKPTVAVAISGGVDSLAAAYLLKTAGHPVIGVHFTTGYEKLAMHPCKNESPPDDPSSSHHAGINAIAGELDIPMHFVDLKAAFRQKVVSYFTSAYAKGVTPNPCLICNPLIKFGDLLKVAFSLGASYLATGHYARIQHMPDKRVHLLKGADPEKDQSYFLGFLTQRQLTSALFPLGVMQKTDVRNMVASAGLTPAFTDESQDICFIGKEGYAAFLDTFDTGAEPGDIVDSNGNIIGRHNGLHLFTVGQRRGINCPAPEPYYVLRLDMERNQLIVGARHERYGTDCTVISINWIDDAPVAPIRVTAKIRYQHEPAKATLIPSADASRSTVRFDAPQLAITPGQGAVFYRDETVLGAGWIAAPDTDDDGCE